MLTNPLARRLSSFIDLTGSEQQALEQWCINPINLSARAKFVREGDRPENVCIMLDGWGCRYIHTRRGDRQIVGILLPGDMCDPRGFILRRADQSLGMLSNATIASVPRQSIVDTVERYPRLGQALWWSTLVEEGIARRWIVNIGRRSAASRLAHLYCELWMRAQAVGLVTGRRFTMPLTQTDLGDALGLTSVHVNRTMKVLREDGMIEIKDREITFLDVERLQRLADFDAQYLQVDRRASF